jgi:hypothetical protein
VNIILLPQEVRGIFVIKAAEEMQNNLPFVSVHSPFWRVFEKNGFPH